MIKKESLKAIAVLGLISLISCLGFLAFSLTTAGPGFPLDDAWIHQAFARNFAENQSWSFQLGQPSGGSTGPFWGLLLAIVHVLGLPEVGGTIFIGFLLLWACSVTAYQMGMYLFPENGFIPLIIGAVLALEWHLVWAALSGMETLLLVLLILLVFLWILADRDDWWIPGILIGISVWVRPDGITLLGPVIFYLLTRKDAKRHPLRSGMVLFICLVMTAGPYFLFNQYVAGEIWPSTFYAKQAEYAVLRQTGFASRLFNVSKQVGTGVGIVLLPGLILEILSMIKKKDWGRSGVLLWAAGYVSIYAARLPVVYQHGRYIMPAIPAFIILGVSGTAKWIELNSKAAWKRVVSAVWGASAAIVLLSFWIFGGKAYALDVGVIETEMVDVAHWINLNTADDAVVGAHDIGGLGYFGGREIIDLAGLITPDVIPFIRDQEQLAEYLDEQGAEYLVTFPGWYPELVQDLQLIYQSSGEFSTLYGMDRMSVYIWE